MRHTSVQHTLVQCRGSSYIPVRVFPENVLDHHDSFLDDIIYLKEERKEAVEGSKGRTRIRAEKKRTEGKMKEEKEWAKKNSVMMIQYGKKDED